MKADIRPKTKCSGIWETQKFSYEYPYAPGIAKYLMDNKITTIEFAEAAKVNHGSLKRVLYGDTKAEDAKYIMIHNVLEYTGLTFEEAFGRPMK